MNFIKISGWSNVRAIGVGRGRLSIQIKTSLCADCTACHGRVEQTKRRMESIGIEGVWERDDEVVTLPIPELPPRGKAQWLTDFFGSEVEFVDWHPILEAG